LSLSTDNTGEGRYLLNFGKTLAYAWPFLVILALIFTYINAPHFFVSYIFQIQNREFQVVEILTFIAAGMAGIILLMSTWKFWKRDNYWAAGLVGLVALAALFFAELPPMGCPYMVAGKIFR
jgi:hypothetical protein